MAVGALVAHFTATGVGKTEGAAPVTMSTATPSSLNAKGPPREYVLQKSLARPAEPAKSDAAREARSGDAPEHKSEPAAIAVKHVEPSADSKKPDDVKSAALHDVTADHGSPTSDSGMAAPLPASTVASDLDARLALKGMTAGSAVMIRIFKQESQLELWIRKDDRFELFGTYAVCRWSGTLGPKLHEGDKQAPEGIYTVAMPQMHRKGRWPRSFNIGFPNAFDKAMERTGSLILVHGGCTSTGCFAMTNPVLDEIHKLSEQALRQGQVHIAIHVFPFRMTESNLATHADSEWQPFWHNLKEVYDVFERTRIPPDVSVCDKKYVVREGTLAGEGEAPLGPQCARIEANLDPEALSEGDVEYTKSIIAHKVVSKTVRKRSAGRDVRKNYAEARKARVEAHAEAARSKQASAARRTQ
jgi:murein L,D-transpeptidase YafK